LNIEILGHYRGGSFSCESTAHTFQRTQPELILQKQNDGVRGHRRIHTYDFAHSELRVPKSMSAWKK
jgi:hypothetical protein